eukprot:GHVQ01040833.1.p2 GENE.GHVQ01040833.1~~GHVQ01040833.1.p2  ORF type:complete len:115 (-),score=12.99 GHVQ01040833.1:254-598(-)
MMRNHHSSCSCLHVSRYVSVNLCICESACCVLCMFLSMPVCVFLIVVSVCVPVCGCVCVRTDKLCVLLVCVSSDGWNREVFEAVWKRWVRRVCYCVCNVTHGEVFFHPFKNIRQ